MIKHLPIIAFILLLSLISCKNEIVNTTIENYPDISLKNAKYLLGREEDVLKILEDCKNDRLTFFKNYRGILQKIKDTLLVDEKLEYQAVGAIIQNAL